MLVSWLFKEPHINDAVSQACRCISIMHEWWISDGSCCGVPLSLPPCLVSIFIEGKRWERFSIAPKTSLRVSRLEKKATDVFSSRLCRFADTGTPSKTYCISQNASPNLRLVRQSVRHGWFCLYSSFSQHINRKLMWWLVVFFWVSFTCITWLSVQLHCTAYI